MPECIKSGYASQNRWVFSFPIGHVRANQSTKKWPQQILGKVSWNKKILCANIKTPEMKIIDYLLKFHHSIFKGMLHKYWNLWLIYHTTIFRDFSRFPDIHGTNKRISLLFSHLSLFILTATTTSPHRPAPQPPAQAMDCHRETESFPSEHKQKSVVLQLRTVLFKRWRKRVLLMAVVLFSESLPCLTTFSHCDKYY